MKKSAFRQVLSTLGLFIAFTVSPFPVSATCIQPPAGLVSWWPGDGNANDIINGNHGTLQNGATFATGMVSQAFSLNFIGNQKQYVSVPDSPILKLTNSFTIALWIFQTGSQAAGYRLVDKETAGIGDGYNFDTYELGGTGRRLRLCTSGSFCGNANTVYSLNSWHFVAVTFNNGAMSFYLDGQPDGSFTGVPAPAVNNLALFIGAPHVGCNGNCGLVEFFQGLIDEVDIYNRAISASDIQAIFNAGNAGKCKPTSPVCDIQLNKTAFVNGDQVIAQVLRVANTTAVAVPIEFKFWFEGPGNVPVAFARGGADGSVILPVGFNQNLGPLTLFTVATGFPRGLYAFDCRFLNPVTGGLQAEDLNPFIIQ